MKVRELIEILSRCPREAEVTTYTGWEGDDHMAIDAVYYDGGNDPYDMADDGPKSGPHVLLVRGSSDTWLPTDRSYGKLIGKAK